MYASEIILALCILLLPFLYETSQIFRYYLKFFTYYAIVMINCIILIPKFAFQPKNVRNLILASAFCHHISSLIGIKWELRGKEHLEKDRACIIVSNHQSSIDILGMFELWPIMDKCTVVAKRELLYAGPFGLAAWLCGLIFIPRINTDQAKTIMNDAVSKLKAEKIKLWVYPEGTRRNTGIIHPFKKGAFHLAISSQLPILPVVITQYYFLDKDIKRFDPGKVIITALPVIPTDSLTHKDLPKLMEQTREKMQQVFHDTNNEIGSRIRDFKDAEVNDSEVSLFEDPIKC